MDPREDEVGNQFPMNMIADGNVEEEERGDDTVTGLSNTMMVLINKPRMYIYLTFHSSIYIHIYI
jgi:hypothetical protein